MLIQSSRVMVFTSVFAVFGLLATPVWADRILGADEVTKLVAGKTIYGHHNKDNYDFKVYFNPNGTGVQVRDNGTKIEGTWKVDSDGKHCVSWAKCLAIVEYGEGQYARLAPNGNKVVTWLKIIDGNDTK